MSNSLSPATGAQMESAKVKLTSGFCPGILLILSLPTCDHHLIDFSGYTRSIIPGMVIKMDLDLGFLTSVLEAAFSHFVDILFLKRFGAILVPILAPFWGPLGPILGAKLGSSWHEIPSFFTSDF